MGTSPDMEIEYECHGKGLLEIKCPATTINKTPNSENYRHLQNKDGHLQLKQNREYSFQIQGQMGITGKKYYDFFLFSFHGYFLQRIHFEKDFWIDMIVKFEKLWNKFVAEDTIYCEQKQLDLIKIPQPHPLYPIINIPKYYELPEEIPIMNEK